MNIEGDVVAFVSTPQCYELEVIGLKLNTVRLLSKPEYVELEENIGFLKKIRIGHNDEPAVSYFERKLTNVLQIGELVGHYLVVFSWKHEGEEG